MPTSLWGKPAKLGICPRLAHCARPTFLLLPSIGLVWCLFIGLNQDEQGQKLLGICLRRPNYASLAASA